MRHIPIGTDDFRKIRQQGDLYVDKSLFIREVLDSPEVILLPRPRRFGKTLNMTMLHAFFDQTQDHRALFDGLAITADPDAMTHLNAHPTVFVSLKKITALTWDECQKRILEVIRDLMEAQKDAIDLTLASSSKRRLFESAYDLQASIEDVSSCLHLVTELLYQSTGKKVIVLIDEYDTPIHQGHTNGYYLQIISFMRGFLGEALKGNPYLQRAVITGILRVAKESIYSGLNNLTVHSVLSQKFSSCFGFTEAEVARLVEEAGSPHPMSEVQAWYNGYRFGQEIIYNPWSILNMLYHGTSPLSIYWINTSANELIAELIQERHALQVGQIESLLRGEAQVQHIEEAVAFNEINESSVWALLLFSGYLTAETWNPATQMATLRLPNLEVRSFFEGQVLAWLGTPGHVNAMLTDLLDLKLSKFGERLAKSIQTILSYHDIGPNTEEKVYHVLMVGLLASLHDRFEVLSNRESGRGRYDLLLNPRRPQLPGFIFEFKQAKPKHLEAAAQAALTQIGERDYAQALRNRGLAKTAWIGLAFSDRDIALASSIFGPDQNQLGDPILFRSTTNHQRTEALLAEVGQDASKGNSPNLFESQAPIETSNTDLAKKSTYSQEKVPAPSPLLTELFQGQALARNHLAELDELPERGDLPPGSRMDHRPNPAFVGREQDLLYLHQALNSREKAVITPLAAATGMGGIGKTQLAIEFAYRYGRYYPGGVFWLDFGEAAQVPSELVACGQEMKLFTLNDPTPENEKVAMVRNAWTADKHLRLLIFDNCESEDLIDTWAPRSGPNRVLITSRNQHWSPELGLQERRLGLLAREESIRLLTDLAPALAPEHANAIATELGDLPLALYLAGSYLRIYKEDPVKYLTELPAVLLKHASLTQIKSRYQPTKHDTHVGRTFALSFDRLNPQDPTDALALDLLLHAAQFAPGEAIAEEHLLATLEAGDHAKKDGLARLTELGLIQNQGQTLTLHRLLQHFCQEAYPAETQVLAEAKVASTVANIAAQINHAGLPSRMAPLLMHLHYLSERFFDRDTALTFELAISMGFHLNTVSAWSEAERYYRRAVAVSEQVYGPEHEKTALCLNNLAQLLDTTNRLVEAEPLKRHALAIDETAFGHNHPKVAIRLNNLASLLQATNRLAEAEPLMRRALAIDEAAFESNHPNVAIRLNNLASLLQATNRLAEAEPLKRRALAIDEAAFGPGHPKVATHLNNLAQLLQATNRLAEAEPLMRRALAIDETAFGPDHPDVAIDLANLARLFLASDRAPAAEPLIQRALAIFVRSFAFDHPYVETAVSIFADVLLALGRSQEEIPGLIQAALSQALGGSALG